MQNPKSGIVALAIVVLPVMAARVEAGLAGGVPEDKITALQVPKLSKAPVIDGNIDRAEWRQAVAISGVANCRDDVLMADPTTFYLGWDDGHLYFACRKYLRQGYKPNVPAGRSQGLAYVWDDALELNWKPMGANVPAENKRNSYKWFLNALGFVGDCSRLSLGQQFKSWNPKFVIKTRLTEPGTAPNEGRWWEMEMSSTPTDFELQGPHRAGDRWRVMLGINHFPAWMQARIPCNGPYLDPFGYNVITLVDQQPAVQMLMEEIPNLATDGTAAATIRAFNPSSNPVQLRVDVDVAGVIKKNKTFTVPAGDASEFQLAEKLPAGIEEGEFIVRVTHQKTELLRYWTKFEAGAHAWRTQPAEKPDPTMFAFTARFNPVRSWLLVKGDTYYLDDPSQARALHYRVTREGDRKTVAEGRITQTAEYYLQDILELPRLQSGRFRVEATMELADGRKLGPMASAFQKKDEAREFARWWGKKYGNVDRVLPPYTGVKHRGDTVSVLLRDYQLGTLGLPTSITVKSEEVTADPARLVVVVDGNEHVAPLGKPTFTKINDWRVEFTGTTSVAGIDFTAKGWVEQDGLVYVDLTYQAGDDRAVRIDALRIEYPLDEEDADCLVCIGPGENLSSRTTVVIPKDKPGRLWSTLDTGISGSGMTVGSFYPTVWIGSERRGLLWWADNDRGWVQEGSVPAHEAVRKDGAVVLVNNVVAKATQVTVPRTLSFSYIATPFKPLPKGWRTTISTEDGTFFTPFRGERTDSKTGEKILQGSGHVNWIHPESRYPEEWDDLWRQQATEGFKHYQAADAHAHSRQRQDPYAARAGVNFTHMSFQIMGYGRKSLEDDTYAYFGDEWEGEFDTWNETYTDYAMSLFAPAFKVGGVRSTYWDLSFPINKFNRLSGLAYQLPDGRTQRGYNGWNVRRFMMRLHALQYDAGLVPGANGFHSTNAYLTVAMPWCDAVLDGERNWDLDTSPLDWVDAYPDERLRSMSSPHNWGVNICWMANMDTNNPTRRDAAKRLQAQWVWMHDSWLNPYIPQLPRMPDSVLSWGVNGQDTVYHPYWRNPFVVLKDRNVLVSLWSMDGRIMLGIFNYDKNQATDAGLKVDWSKLGIDPNQAYARLLWTETGSDATVELGANGMLQVRALPGHRLILVGIAAPEAAELKRATEALPVWVRGGLPAAVTDFGLVHKETRHFTPGHVPGVTCDNAAIKVGMWQLANRVLLTVYNTEEDAENSATLTLDFEAIGLAPKLPWQEFVRAHNLCAEQEAPAPSLDYHNDSLSINSIPPKSGRLVAIRRY